MHHYFTSKVILQHNIQPLQMSGYRISTIEFFPGLIQYLIQTLSQLYKICIKSTVKRKEILVRSTQHRSLDGRDFYCSRRSTYNACSLLTSCYLCCYKKHSYCKCFTNESMLITDGDETAYAIKHADGFQYNYVDTTQSQYKTISTKSYQKDSCYRYVQYICIRETIKVTLIIVNCPSRLR